MSPNPLKPCNGFTLAELLIALAILGVVATFTIPKIITANTNSQYNASAKEVAATLSAAYQNYMDQNGMSASTSVGSITPYINYISVDSTSTIDLWQTGTTRTCNGFYTCLKLHNGGTLLYANTETFTGTNTTNAVYFLFDPDGQVTDGTTNGPGKSVEFWLYVNGSLKTAGTALPNTVFGGGTFATPDPTRDPPYFAW